MSSALDVLCPACNTPPGMRCRTLATRRSADPHKARRDSYRAGDVTIPTRWAEDDGREIAWMTFSATNTGGPPPNSYSESQTPSPGAGRKAGTGGLTFDRSSRCRRSKPRPDMREARAPRSSGRVSGSLPAAIAADMPMIAHWAVSGKTHTRTDTCDQGCVIHNRTNHHMKHWLLIWRDDRGIFERLCPEHGCGHPDPNQGPYWAATDQDWQWVHGCCGCCRGVNGEDSSD